MAKSSNFRTNIRAKSFAKLLRIFRRGAYNYTCATLMAVGALYRLSHAFKWKKPLCVCMWVYVRCTLQCKYAFLMDIDPLWKQTPTSVARVSHSPAHGVSCRFFFSLSLFLFLLAHFYPLYGSVLAQLATEIFHRTFSSVSDFFFPLSLTLALGRNFSWNIIDFRPDQTLTFLLCFESTVNA